jgi:hypothetical protein
VSAIDVRQLVTVVKHYRRSFFSPQHGHQLVEGAGVGEPLARVDIAGEILLERNERGAACTPLVGNETLIRNAEQPAQKSSACLIRRQMAIRLPEGFLREIIGPPPVASRQPPEKLANG